MANACDIAFRIRPAMAADLPALRPVFEAAKAIMRADGNPTQWAAPGFPPDALILRDIERGGGYVIETFERWPVGAGHDETKAPVMPDLFGHLSSRLVAYFALLPSPEPTYDYIDGAWLTDEPYGVIHRMASYPDAHGIFAAIMDFAAARYAHLRIDTHRDNRIMRHLIEKHGFTYCGIIWLTDGTERLAYER
jgi:GNAT superfamily N-acetyltransferase